MNPIEALRNSIKEEEKEETLYSWIRSQSNIIISPGINWSTVYCLTEEQVDKFKKLYVKSTDAPRFDVQGPHEGFVGFSLSIIMNLRKWLKSDHKPGVKEKDHIRTLIKDARENKKFTGIAESAYDDILARLDGVEDIPDTVGYSIHFHL